MSRIFPPVNMVCTRPSTADMLAIIRWRHAGLVRGQPSDPPVRSSTSPTRSPRRDVVVARGAAGDGQNSREEEARICWNDQEDSRVPWRILICTYLPEDSEDIPFGISGLAPSLIYIPLISPSLIGSLGQLFNLNLN